MIRVEPIICDEIPPALKGDWRRLIEASFKPNFQLEFEIVSAWARCLRGNWKMLLLPVYRDAAIIGIFPLMFLDGKRRGVLPFRRVRFLANTHTDFSTILAPMDDVGAVAEACLAWLTSGDFRWEMLVLDDLQGGDPAASAIGAALQKRGMLTRRHEGKYYFIDLRETWDKIWARTSKKYVRRNVQQGIGRLSRAGTWCYVHDPDWSIDTILNRAGPIHKARQSLLGRDSVFSQPAWLAFIRESFEHHRGAKRVRSHWLELKGELVAYIIAFSDLDTYHLWSLGFLPAHANLNCSSVLLAEVVKLAASDGFRKFSFMRGETEYKTKWTPRYDANLRFTVRGTWHLYGKFVGLLERVAAAARQTNDRRNEGP